MCKSDTKLEGRVGREDTMKIKIDITNDNELQAEKLYSFLHISLGESRLENAIHEFLVDNGIKGSDVIVTVCDVKPLTEHLKG